MTLTGDGDPFGANFSGASGSGMVLPFWLPMREDLAAQEMHQLRKAYNDIARDFSESRKEAWPEFELLSTFIAQGSKVLDLGCGNGRFFEAIREKSVNYTGVDFSRRLLEIARRKYPTLSFLESQITQLPFDDESFDVVVSVASLHHLASPKRRLEALREAYRVLRPNGFFLVSVWNLWQRRYLKFFLRSFSRSIFSLGSYGFKDLSIPFGKSRTPRYYYAFSARELLRLLKDSGFHIEHFTSSAPGRYNYTAVCRKTTLQGVGYELFVQEHANSLPSFQPLDAASYESK